MLVVLFLYFSCTFPVLFLYFSCTFPVLFLYFFLYFSCTFPVLFLYFSCTFPVLFLYFSCTFSVLFLYISCTFPVLFLYFSCWNIPHSSNKDIICAGFTYSMLNTIGTAGDLFTGKNYEFQCTAKNIFGETSVIKSIQITSSKLNQIYLSLFILNNDSKSTLSYENAYPFIFVSLFKD